jgi:hypothetical protein
MNDNNNLLVRFGSTDAIEVGVVAFATLTAAALQEARDKREQLYDALLSVTSGDWKGAYKAMMTYGASTAAGKFKFLIENGYLPVDAQLRQVSGCGHLHAARSIERLAACLRVSDAEATAAYGIIKDMLAHDYSLADIREGFSLLAPVSRLG